MTIYDWVSIVMLLLTIAVNSASVYLQKTRRIYDKFGSRGYAVHTGLISFVWGAFIITEFLANRSTWRFSHAHPLPGLVIMAVALALFIAALQQVGSNALSNGNFFGRPLRKLGGVYRYVREPMYMSYAVWFLGLCLLTSMKVFLVYSAITLVGLVGFESYIERPERANTQPPQK